ncbi:helix-turn-helix transcriptional regulator [Bordetella trematum]|nr:helix-turn-helix transcriptional regulator [Bordetella trematum]
MRLQKGLSQTQLADLIGTSQSHIAKIEAGQVRIYLDTANRLAVALSVSLDKLNALLDSTSAESSSKVA